MLGFHGCEVIAMSFELILPFLRPIKPLLLDESVSEIMGNPDASWFFERDGILCHEPNISFDADRLRTGLEVIANQLGKKLDEDNPRLQAQLPDGSRLAAWIPPLVSPAPAIAIRKFTSRHYTVGDLIARGTLTQPIADLLAEQTRSGKTLLISGGTGTGKTYLQHFELVSKSGDVPGAFRVLERIRGRTLAWALEDRKAWPTEESEQTASLETDLAGLQVQLMQTNSAEKREQLMDRLVEYERRLGLSWTTEDAPAHGLPVRPASLATVQEDLKPDELLLEYVLDDPTSFCVSVSRKGAYVRVLPVGHKVIEKLSQEFVGEIRAKGTGTELSKQLYALLVKPIPEAATQTRFIIAPDGILNLLPFEVLRDAQSEYLLRSRVISYVPSGTILDTLRRTEKQLAPRLLLAVGDVAYENQGGAGRRIPPPLSLHGRIERSIADLSGIGLHDLPQTRAEVKEIGRIVGSDVVILLGKDATETAFKKQPLDQFRILHLAVHGFADALYPERSALVLGTDPQSADDGLLQVREIIRLRLNSELTTLSACDSGVGKLQGQEGISNLVEAFLVAGSKSVVASLWSADDMFASALMEQFYRHLAQGEDTSSALRNAKLDLLAKYGDQASPFYWAAFIAVGETSTPIGIRRQ
jgi:CHAT domain-containing protein